MLDTHHGDQYLNLMPDTLSGTAFLAEVPGLNYRRLDYWCRHGIFGTDVVDLGSGSRRRFHRDDIRVARALTLASDFGSQMARGTGMSVKNLRMIAAEVRAKPRAKRLQLTFCDGRALLTLNLDGEKAA